MKHVHRPDSQTTREFYAALLDDPVKGQQVIETASVGINGAVYIALATPNGVEAWIASHKWNKFWYENYSYQLHRETDWPSSDYRFCPERILKLLAPVELLYENESERKMATGWRKSCWDEIAKRKQRPVVSKGTVIRFAYKLRFKRTKETYDTFRWLYGSHFELVGPPGGLFIIRNWRRRDWKILNQAELAELNLQGEMT